jgi:hypothetical protein
MGEIYDKAEFLDEGIAKRWKQRSREDLTRPLTVADVDFIVGPVFAPTAKVTEDQGKALIVIFEVAKVTPEGIKRLRFYVDRALDAEDRGRVPLNLVPVTDDAGLAPVYQALSNEVVSRIMFRSPGTGIAYAPFDYLGVRELVSSKRITVYQPKLGGLSRISMTDGVYMSKFDRLFVYEFVNPLPRTLTIVHEATHAIQDWKDVDGKRRDIEADAYIADRVAELTVRPIAMLDYDTDDPILVAAQMVLGKQAGDGNKDWLKAYKKASDHVASVIKFPNIRTDDAREPTKESEIFKQVMRSVELSQAMWSQMRATSAEYQRLLQGIDLAKYAPR